MENAAFLPMTASKEFVDHHTKPAHTENGYTIHEKTENGFSSDYWNVIDSFGDIIAVCPNKPCAEKILKSLKMSGTAAIKGN